MCNLKKAELARPRHFCLPVSVAVKGLIFDVLTHCCFLSALFVSVALFFYSLCLGFHFSCPCAFLDCHSLNSIFLRFHCVISSNRFSLLIQSGLVCDTFNRTDRRRLFKLLLHGNYFPSFEFPRLKCLKSANSV